MKYIRGGDYRSLTDFDDLKVGTTASKTKVGGRAGGQTDGLIGLLFGVLGALLLSPEFHSVEGRVELSLERRRHGRLLGGVTVLLTNTAKQQLALLCFVVSLPQPLQRVLRLRHVVAALAPPRRAAPRQYTVSQADRQTDGLTRIGVNGKLSFSFPFGR